VRDGRWIVALKLLELVAIERRQAAGREDVRELEEHRGGAGACRLQLLDRLLALAELFELALDLIAVRDLALDVVDVRLHLLIVLWDLRGLVLFRFLKEKREDDPAHPPPDDDQEPRRPRLARGPSCGRALLGK